MAEGPDTERRRGHDYPNLRHIRLLEAAARLGSLSRAAAEVHISQPAASQALGKLRQIYGADLLVRQGNGVICTPEGAVVSRRAGRALGHIREITRRVAARSHLARGLAIDRLESHATIAQLRAIAAFAEAGSFAAAALAMGQTEPSVQRAARELERIGGVPLFTGAHRALQLSSEGRQVAARASLALAELDRAHEELREQRGLYDGRLVVGALPLARTSILPEAVVSLTARHPEARVELVDGAYEDLVHRLGIGRIDMIVGALRQERAPVAVEEESLFTDRLAIVARRDHPLAGAAMPDPARLAEFAWVLSRKGTPNRAVFDERICPLLSGQTGRRGHVVTGSLVALRGILMRSDGLALLSPHQVGYELETGLLALVGPPLAGSERPIGVTTLPGWAPTALQSAFLEALRAVASD